MRDIRIPSASTLLADRSVVVRHRGDPEHARFFDSTGIPLYRVVHYKDAIPHVPLKKMGFRHMKTEVYYEEKSRLLAKVRPRG